MAIIQTLQAFTMYMNIDEQCNRGAIPLLSAFPFCSSFVSLYLLGTFLAVIGSCPPQSQVTCKLISPFPSPSPYTPHSEIPTPWGFPELNIHITKTTSRAWLTRSSTLASRFTSVSASFLNLDLSFTKFPAPLARLIFISLRICLIF